MKHQHWIRSAAIAGVNCLADHGMFGSGHWEEK
ncbi:hypothetical protein QFZ78_006245 [Paenibacillus sp. V4I5]|nr:hypothetical protein [Paenibacillus sp. V4I5]